MPQGAYRRFTQRGQSVSFFYRNAYVERALLNFIERILKRMTQPHSRRYDAQFHAYVETGLKGSLEGHESYKRDRNR